jgi:hypothetical protein
VTTLVISHRACLAHDMGEGHPEQPERLRAIASTPRLYRNDPRGDADAGAHRRRRRYLNVAGHLRGSPSLDRGRNICSRRCDDTKGQKRLRRHAAARPSCRSRDADGFCFFNNAAIAARHAQALHGAERVARSSTLPCAPATEAKPSAKRWKSPSCRASKRSRPIFSSSRPGSTASWWGEI